MAPKADPENAVKQVHAMKHEAESNITNQTSIHKTTKAC